MQYCTAFEQETYNEKIINLFMMRFAVFEMTKCIVVVGLCAVAVAAAAFFAYYD